MLIGHGVLTPRKCARNRLFLTFSPVKWRPQTEEMDWWLKDTVCHHTPMDFGYDTVLWTREILAELLREKYGIDVGGSTVSLHLKRLGLSYRKPWFRANEQDPRKVEHFLHDTFPRIQRLAEKTGADIAF